jgi:uncharacterized membrane protein
MTLTHTVRIERSAQDVFTFLSDFSNDPEWRANVLEMRATGSSTAPGGIWSRQIEVRKVPGRTIETEAVITAFEPPGRITIQRASGPIRPVATYELEQQGAETMVRFRLGVSLQGIKILAWPLVALFLSLAVRPSLKPDFERLRNILEAEAKAPRDGR